MNDPVIRPPFAFPHLHVIFLMFPVTANALKETPNGHPQEHLRSCSRAAVLSSAPANSYKRFLQVRGPLSYQQQKVLFISDTVVLTLNTQGTEEFWASTGLGEHVGAKRGAEAHSRGRRAPEQSPRAQSDGACPWEELSWLIRSPRAVLMRHS